MTSSRSTKNEAQALFLHPPERSESHLITIGRFKFLTHGAGLPMRQNIAETAVRRQFIWQGATYTALCELARPIRRQALRPIAFLDESVSQAIMERFWRVLAH